LSMYAAPMFLANINHSDIEIEKDKIAAEAGIEKRYMRDLRYSKELTAISMRIILAHPFSYIRYHVISSFSFLFSSSIQYVVETYKQAMHIPYTLGGGAMSQLVSGNIKSFLVGSLQVWWKLIERLGWLIIYAIALVGVWYKRRNKLTWVFVFITAYLMLLAGPLGNARYAVQSLPFKFLLFACGAYLLREKFSEKNV
jgi:hypothetical protein